MAKRKKTTGYGREVREDPIGMYRWEADGLAVWFSFAAGPVNMGWTDEGGDHQMVHAHNLAEAGFVAEGMALGRRYAEYEATMKACGATPANPPPQ